MRLLTVGLPVYNGMPYLPETVESLLRQSYADFDLLIINDGSVDGSREYLDSLSDPRVKVIHQENSGLTATLNRMLAEAKTPWLVRQDADDIAYPERLERTVSYIEKHPDAGMFYSLANYYQDRHSFGNFRTTVASATVITNFVRSGYVPALCHPSVTLNVAKTLALGGYRFDLCVEDADLWWRMALSHDLVLIPEKLVGYRINCDGISAQNLEKQAINSLYVQYLLLSHLWNLTPLSYEEVKDFLSLITSRKKLKFREQIRLANVNMGKGGYLSAARHLIRALFVSPAHFFERVAYEFGKEAYVVNGVDPRTFVLHSDKIWSLQ